MLTIEAHPLADVYAFRTLWPSPLGDVPMPAWLDPLTRLPASGPFSPFDDQIKKTVRDLLRHGGFKPAGRNKPCSEYLQGAAARDAFPRINAAVDACNVTVLQSALPISTVDLRRIAPPLRIEVAPKGASYVFNPSGQEIDLSGLLCLHDADGPCANAVKDAQRAKTSDDTVETLSIVWGTCALPGRSEAVNTWYVDLVQRLGGSCTQVVP